MAFIDLFTLSNHYEYYLFLGMNPFMTLSDDPILHICSYLPRQDLQKLSEVDKNFYRIISESRETSLRIPLILNIKHRDFKQPCTIDHLTELTNERFFTALTLKGIYKTIPRKLTSLLQHLSGSVELLMIFHSKFNEKQFRKLLQMFLPKLKTCKVYNVFIIPDAKATINEEDIEEQPLKHLAVGNTELVKYFDGCHQLKSFQFKTKGDTDIVYDFLFHQKRLEKLSFDSRDINLDRISCFDLKQLKLPNGVEHAASKFLQKLPNLTKLEIIISDQPSLHPIMTAICSASKLEELVITIYCKNSAIQQKRLVNDTVKKLRIVNRYVDDVTCWLLQIFQAVESVSLSNHFMCDPSDVPHRTIDKIKFLNVQAPIHIQFSPIAVPANVKSFETAVMRFAERFSSIIDEITIGHENWRNDKDFRLSNPFCKGIVNCLPNLTLLELFNVADRGKLISFLDGHRKSLKNLKQVNLHKSYRNGPKRMRIEAD